MKKIRNYYRTCGICHGTYEQSDMIRDDQSPTGWICIGCHTEMHPEYNVEEW